MEVKRQIKPAIRVGIDASGLIAEKPATGLQRYISSLLTALAPRCETERLNLHLYFIHPIPPLAVDHPLTVLRSIHNVSLRVAPVARGWWRFGMGVAMLMDRLDLFHFPTPQMAGYCPVPSVVTFHDLAALSIGGDHTRKEQGYLPDALEAGRRATALIAVSQSAGNEVVQHLGRPDVVVIPEGVDLVRFWPVSAETVESVRKQYGLDRYVLCVGTLQARKNHLGLIQAFEQIQTQISHTLVIAGTDGSGAAEIHAYLDKRPDLRVRRVGYVDEKLLPALYTGADALALPSLWEGFGLPLLEAMACGTPVLTSNISSLAEITEDAAVLVDPTDTVDIAQKLYAILTDEALRERLITAGYHQARKFSWERAAEQTIAVYRQALSTTATKAARIRMNG
jgi:glycosyltransferase involved in cell wall biosynthesis